MASQGFAARRQVEAWISEGLITVNGEVAHLGQKIDPTKDELSVNGKKIKQQDQRLVTLIMNKPKGFVCSHAPESGQRSVYELVPAQYKTLRLLCAGRLDQDSEGMLILTNDGALVQTITHPSGEISKRYWVRLSRPFDEQHIPRLLKGVLDDGEWLKCDRIVKSSPDRGWGKEIEVHLNHGKKREIRRIFSALGYTVERLRRFQIGRLRLKGVGLAECSALKPMERDWLLSNDDKKSSGASKAPAGSKPEWLKGGPKPAVELENMDIIDTEEKKPEFKPRPDFQKRSESTPRPEFQRREQGGFRPREERREFSDRPQFGERPRRDFGDRPRYASSSDRPQRAFSDRPRYESSDRPQRSFSDKAPGSYGPKPDGFRSRPRSPNGAAQSPSFPGFKPRSDSAPRPGFQRRDGEGFRPREERREFSDRPQFGDRPRRDFGDRPRYSSDSDRPQRAFGDRPHYASSSDRPQRAFGDRPQRAFGPRSDSGAPRPQFQRRDGEGFRPREERREFSDRPQFGDRPRRDFGDRPRYSSDSDRPQRSFGDRPRGHYSPRADGDAPKPAFPGFPGKSNPGSESAPRRDFSPQKDRRDFSPRAPYGSPGGFKGKPAHAKPGRGPHRTPGGR